MSLKLPQAPNAGLFKQGYQSYSSADGVIIRNIEAVREISSIVLSSMGPNGTNKIIVNQQGKMFITNDAATIVREMEIVHPAVKILIMASKQQEFEMGDNTNLVVILAGELLNIAEKLLNLGLSVAEVIQGYSMASKYALETLDKLVVSEVESVNETNEVMKAVRAVVSAKQHESEDIVSKLVVDAVNTIINPRQPKGFNVDSVRVVKVMGASLPASHVVKGMVFPREPDGAVKEITRPTKVAVFTCPIDISTTETKGTVLLHNAKEMLDFSKGEEAQLDKMASEIKNSGVGVVISGSSIGDLALHYFNKHNILVLRVPSKFDIRRICQVCGASPLARLGAPMPDEMGLVDVVATKEIGGDRVTVFRQNESISKTATIVLRGATHNLLDDIERAIDDGVNSIRGLIKDNRLLPGAGAVEMELIKHITKYGESTPGLMQLAIKNFAKAFEVIPRVLCDTSGLDASQLLSELYAAHSAVEDKPCSLGVEVDGETSNSIFDAKEAGIFDLLSTKKSAIELATDAANTILSIDQIIMAKKAGGPQPPQARPGNWDQDD